MTPNDEAKALTDAEVAAMPFDDLVARLQRIVQQLEAGSVGLEQSIALYTEGLRLHAAAEERLRDAELKITELGRRGVAEESPDPGGDPPA